MNPIYKRLAERLDTIPNGFPATESGVELCILEKLFSPQEAALAAEMSLDPESAAVIAGRLGIEERETAVVLKKMVRKGLITLEKGKGQLLFRLIPFIVGFYERQNAKIDAEFARLFEQYYRESLHKIMNVKPSVHRVIPVEKAIAVSIDIMPYQLASRYLEEAQSWGVLNCICRVQKSLIGQDCGHSKENCLVFSHRPDQFSGTDDIRAISKEEALRILKEAEEEGLVHTTSNMQEGVDYICNCCSCSCGILRGIAEYGSLNAVAASGYLIRVDEELCTSCGLCVERCQFRALSLAEDICRADVSRCFGCGLCATVCPSEALSLSLEPESRLQAPPVSEEDWRAARREARERGSSLS